MLKNRALVAVLLGFWLALGPVASAWAASASHPCENMSSSAPADEGCDDAMDALACLSVCMSAAPLISTPAVHTGAVVAAEAAVPAPSLRFVTVVAPPDVAPPKSFLS